MRGLDIIKLTKISLIYSVSLSIWGLGDLFRGLCPPKPPVATGLVRSREERKLRAEMSCRTKASSLVTSPLQVPDI